MVRFGVPGQNVDPLAYADGRLSSVPAIQAPRRPTVNDKKFPIWCEWRVNKHAVAPVEEGEFWKLIRFESNGDATWVKMDTGSSATGLDDISDQVGTQVTPTALTKLIDINGAVVANAANPSNIPLETVADVAGHTLNVQLQVAADITGAPGDKNDAGICSFSDTQFVVNADGYVTLIGGVAPPIQKADVDKSSAPGTDPVVADGTGTITVAGAVVAAHSVPIETHSRAANAYNIEVQVASDITGAPGNKSSAGLCSFDDTSFVVDNDGYVTLKGGSGPAIDNINVDANTAPGTDPVVADGTGTITVAGAVVAAHSVPIETHSRAANAYNIEVQYAASAASTTAASSGIAHFDSGDFGVDANGFVTYTGTGGSGARVLISTTTINNDASLEWTGLSSTYAQYILELDNYVTVSSSVSLRLRTSIDNGVSFDSGAGNYVYTLNGGSTAQTAAQLTAGISISSFAGFIRIINPTNNSPTHFFSRTNSVGSGEDYCCGSRQHTQVVDAVQIYMSSGNIASGTIRLYGIKAT